MKYTNHQYMTKIFHFFQKKLGTTEGYSTISVDALKTNVLIWSMFMSSSMKAAIHLWPNCLANLEVYKNTNFEEIQSLFNTTQKLILEHSEEILNVNTIGSASPSWTRSAVSHDQDSVLCLGKMNDSRDAITRWEGQVEEFKMSLFFQRIAGNRWRRNWIRVESFPRIFVIRDSSRDPVWFAKTEHWKTNSQTGSSSFMFNDIDWTRKGNDGICISNSEKVKEYAKRFSQGHWTFFGPGYDKKWYGTLPGTLEGKMGLYRNSNGGTGATSPVHSAKWGVWHFGQ